MMPLPQVEKELTEAICRLLQFDVCMACEEDASMTCVCRLSCGTSIRGRCTGKSPNLEDVLKAKDLKIDADFAQWKDHELKPPYGTVGEVKKGLKKKYDEKIIADYWKLGVPLSEQSEETKRFIHSLLAV